VHALSDAFCSCCICCCCICCCCCCICTAAIAAAAAALLHSLLHLLCSKTSNEHKTTCGIGDTNHKLVWCRLSLQTAPTIQRVAFGANHAHRRAKRKESRKLSFHCQLFAFAAASHSDMACPPLLAAVPYRPCGTCCLCI